jgi:hypothetical protein
MSQIDDILWLQCIARGTLDNGSLTAAVQISIELICLTLRGLFVRCISNLPSACDKKFAKGAQGSQSSTAAQFPVSSQKPCYDFNFRKGCFKQVIRNYVFHFDN